MCDSNEKPRVEFVSYTGEYPNLCTGILSLLIDGKLVHFGHDYTKDWKNDGNYDSFWTSGGKIESSEGESYSTYGEWTIYRDLLPDEYQELAYEIDKVFNRRVPHGCCGGCC